jgi:hypothetical protein
MHNWGRMRAPPGNTAWRIASIKRGGALAVRVNKNCLSRAVSMRFNKLMGPPAGVATAAPTIRSDIHKCQFNMTLGFVNGKNKEAGSGF